MEPAFTGSRFLESLSPTARQLVLRHARPADLPLHTFLSSQESERRGIWFLTSGIASVVFTSHSGNTIELATVGCEGVIGALAALGDDDPTGACEMQLAGKGLRLGVEHFRAIVHDNPEVRYRLHDFVQHQLNQAYQILACNRLHRARARFSRWLLMVQDRHGSPVLPMTQEFLADMLGTRRTTVSEVAGELQRLGAIEYRRGVIRIVDRCKLEHAACECYPLLKARYDRLYTSAVQSFSPGLSANSV